MVDVEHGGVQQGVDVLQTLQPGLEAPSALCLQLPQLLLWQPGQRRRRRRHGWYWRKGKVRRGISTNWSRRNKLSLSCNTTDMQLLSMLSDTKEAKNVINICAALPCVKNVVIWFYEVCLNYHQICSQYQVYVFKHKTSATLSTQLQCFRTSERHFWKHL